MIKLSNPVVSIVCVIILVLPIFVPFVEAWRNPDSEFAASSTTVYSLTESATTLTLGAEDNLANYIIRNFNVGGSSTQLSEPAHQILRAMHILTGDLNNASGSGSVAALAVYIQYIAIVWVLWIVLSVVTLPIRFINSWGVDKL